MSSKPPLTAKTRDALIAERDAALAEAQRLRVLTALRWTEEVRHDVPPPSHNAPFRAQTEGYEATMHDPRFGGKPRILRVVSCSCYHGTYDMDYTGPLKTTSQHAKRCSSTIAHALRVLRCEKEREFAAALASIDRAIEAEVAKAQSEAQALTEALS